MTKDIKSTGVLGFSFFGGGIQQLGQHYAAVYQNRSRNVEGCATGECISVEINFAKVRA